MRAHVGFLQHLMYALLAGTISFDPNLRPELLAGRDVLDVVGPILDHTSVLLPGARCELSVLVRKTRTCMLK